MLHRLPRGAAHPSPLQPRQQQRCRCLHYLLWGSGPASWGAARGATSWWSSSSRASPAAAAAAAAAGRPAGPGSVATLQAQAPAPAARTRAGAAAAGGDGPWLIVGLGNPGPRYDATRHNVGFMVVDALARGAGIDMRKLERSAAVGRGQLQGVPVILAKPVTFMNNSGDSVAALARFYKVPTQRILVISDDLDQPLAAVRLRQKGGHGGHNGLRSIIAQLGSTHDFPRLKIGIGRPPGQMEVASYVLQPFAKSEMAEVEGAIAESLRVVDAVLALGLDKALSGSRL